MSLYQNGSVDIYKNYLRCYATEDRIRNGRRRQKIRSKVTIKLVKVRQESVKIGCLFTRTIES